MPDKFTTDPPTPKSKTLKSSNQTPNLRSFLFNSKIFHRALVKTMLLKSLVFFSCLCWAISGNPYESPSSINEVKYSLRGLSETVEPATGVVVELTELAKESKEAPAKSRLLTANEKVAKQEDAEKAEVTSKDPVDNVVIKKIADQETTTAGNGKQEDAEKTVVKVTDKAVIEGTATEDKVNLGADKVNLGADKVNLGADKVNLGADKVNLGADKVNLGADKVNSGADKAKPEPNKAISGEETPQLSSTTAECFTDLIDNFDPKKKKETCEAAPKLVSKAILCVKSKNNNDEKSPVCKSEIFSQHEKLCSELKCNGAGTIGGRGIVFLSLVASLLVVLITN